MFNMYPRMQDGDVFTPRSEGTDSSANAAVADAGGITDEERAMADSLGYDPDDMSAPELEYVRTLIREAAEAQTKDQSQPLPLNPTATGENPGAFAPPVYGPGVEPDSEPYIGVWGDPRGGDVHMQRYSQDSAQHILNGMTTAELDALEREFYRAGYWDEDQKGTFGGRASMIGTFSQIIVAADANRVSWEKQMEGDANAFAIWQEANPDEAVVEKSWKQRNPFVAPDFLKPDYATLAQRTKLEIRNGLGRDPTSSEMTLLTQYLASAKKDEWQANTYDPSLANWEKRARAHETETSQMGSSTLQAVDADARFNEMFDDRYEDELDHRERVAASGRKTRNLFGSIDTISRMTS